MFGAILSGLGSLFGASTATVGGALAASVGSTLISGLAGKGSQSQITQNVVDYEDMRKRAEAAGFNPLTALQNGGSAGFTRSTTTVPGLSSSQILKNAAAEGVKTWFNRDQIMRDQERDKLELALMRKELESINQTSAVVRDKDFGYSIPHAVQRAGGDHVQVSAPALSRPADVRGAAAGAGSRIAGELIPHNPNWDSADAIEQRYGDALSWAYGAGVAAADGFPWLKQKLAEGRPERFQRQLERKGAPPRRPSVGPLYAPDQPSLAPLPKRSGPLGFYRHPLFSGF